MNILKTQSERGVIHIKCRDLYKQDIDRTITDHLQKRYGDVCGKNGYVIGSSIQLIDRTIGKLVSIDTESCIEYRVTYKMQAIYPSPEDKYDCIIENNTKMGLIAYLDYSQNDEQVTLKNSPILFIIPVDFGGSGLTVGDKATVSVLDSRIKFQSRQIQCVAKIS
jgi:hypothetical protein